MHRFLVPALILCSVARSAEPVQVALIPSPERTVAEPIQLDDARGKPLELASHRGSVVLVDFWATWCGGCTQELPWFQEFESQYGGGKFAVIAVSMDEGWGVVTPFLDALSLSLDVALDDGDVSSRYGIREMPAAFLIDRKGRVAARYVGLVDRDNIEANIRLLLAED